HPARVRRCAQLSVLLLDRRDTSERPVGPDGDLMAAGAQILHVVRAEPPFERERPWREPARIERRDEVVGVELRCVDRLLEVEAAIDVSEEDVERPLLLLVAARCSPREPGLSVAQRKPRAEGRPRPRAGTNG